jgi:hypothetical protein
MIKNWKLFLENFDDDDSNDDANLKANGEQLKVNLKALFGPIFLVEFVVRQTGDTNQLSQGVDMICDVLIKSFQSVLESKEDFSEEFVEILLKSFTNSLESAKEIMIEESFAKGIDFMVDTFINTLMDIKKSNDSDGEEWRQEKEVSYEDMTKTEINNLIDQALDDRDFTRVKFLSKYIKESFDYNAKVELEKIGKEIAELIIKFVKENIPVK